MTSGVGARTRSAPAMLTRGAQVTACNHYESRCGVPLLSYTSQALWHSCSTIGWAEVGKVKKRYLVPSARMDSQNYYAKASGIYVPLYFVQSDGFFRIIEDGNLHITKKMFAHQKLEKKGGDSYSIKHEIF